MTKRMLAAFAVALGFLASHASAANVLPLFLDELIDGAGLVFDGRCIGNRTQRDPASGLIVTYTTFEVRDVLKGTTGATHVIKQVGGVLPGEKIAFRLHGVPEFAAGESYVVFLPPASREGFSSPVGLAQGRFSLKPGRLVSNGRDFRDMAARMLDRLPPVARAKLEKSGGALRDMDVDDFKQAVRSHVARSR